MTIKPPTPAERFRMLKAHVDSPKHGGPFEETESLREIEDDAQALEALVEWHGEEHAAHARTEEADWSVGADTPAPPYVSPNEAPPGWNEAEYQAEYDAERARQLDDEPEEPDQDGPAGDFLADFWFNHGGPDAPEPDEDGRGIDYGEEN